MQFLSGRLRYVKAPFRQMRNRTGVPSHGGVVASGVVLTLVCETEASTARTHALAASPPKLPGVAKRTAIPELCLSLPKTRRRRRRRGEGGGSGGGGDGDGGGGGWSEEAWNDDDGDRFWMWLVLSVYSIIQGLILLNREQKTNTPSPFAALTVSTKCVLATEGERVSIREDEKRKHCVQRSVCRVAEWETVP